MAVQDDQYNYLLIWSLRVIGAHKAHLITITASLKTLATSSNIDSVVSEILSDFSLI